MGGGVAVAASAPVAEGTEPLSCFKGDVVVDGLGGRDGCAGEATAAGGR